VGSSPELVDTDGDGFSDLLEVRQSNAGFDPLFSGDADCRMATDRLDDDGDGLLNCEERYFGTNSRLIDSDGDGFPDDVEVRMGTNPAAADALYDSDFDGARNGTELQAHTDPLHNDVADFSRIAYRYSISLLRDQRALPGRLCYDFSVTNITLAPTGTATGLPEGTNTVLIRVASTPADSPEDFGNHQVACVRPRYRRNPEVKMPSSGQMVVPSRRSRKRSVPPRARRSSMRIATAWFLSGTLAFIGCASSKKDDSQFNASTDGGPGADPLAAGCVVDDSKGGSSAIPLVAGSKAVGQICPRGDQDYFSIEGGAGMNLLDVSLAYPSSVTKVNLQVQLLQADGITEVPGAVATDSDANDGKSAVVTTFAVPSPGSTSCG